MMKNLLFLASLLFVSGCCTKKGCDDGGDINQINFVNFTNQELDTVFLQGYDPSGMGMMHDTLSAYTYFPSDTIVTLELGGSLQTDWLYEISLPATGDTFEVYNFVLEERTCDNGPAWCETPYYALKSYAMNGVVHPGPFIEIVK